MRNSMKQILEIEWLTYKLTQETNLIKKLIILDQLNQIVRVHNAKLIQ